MILLRGVWVNAIPNTMPIIRGLIPSSSIVGILAMKYEMPASIATRSTPRIRFGVKNYFMINLFCL